MTDVALQTRNVGALRRVGDGLRALGLGIKEGFAAARRFESLSAMSDADLERLGVARAELPWYALSGTRPPR
jgi:hypothetical protein